MDLSCRWKHFFFKKYIWEMRFNPRMLLRTWHKFLTNVRACFSQLQSLYNFVGGMATRGLILGTVHGQQTFQPSQSASGLDHLPQANIAQFQVQVTGVLSRSQITNNEECTGVAFLSCVGRRYDETSGRQENSTWALPIGHVRQVW